MLACALPTLPSVTVAAKRKAILLQNCFPSLHHRRNRITGSTPALSSNFLYRPPHLVPARLARMTLLSGLISFPSNSTELRDEADFESILTPEGYIYVCGFGSLLSEKSARSTFPNLRNFQAAFLPGFRRVFAHIAPIFYERGIAKEETKEVSSLSVEPCEGEGLIVTVFEIARSERGRMSSASWLLFLRLWMALVLLIQRCFVHVIVMRSTFRSDAKVIRIFTFRIMEGLTSIRYGGMISYLVVFILDIGTIDNHIFSTLSTTNNFLIFV
ncbi:uncharacterized protein LOC110104004 isoform X4 [Dendrobium catenatum]|uniref:uncharacterized protein LOC110104004 isoform X4 n=1 Tax=Dendrobium catenatum TaxID=906689 RepID=UPI0010A05F2B|nr:uncharacterized protein LOC110104004 isoform X4 [Dendrobium catenatum]